MSRQRPSGITLSAVWFFLSGLENMGYGALMAFLFSFFLSLVGIGERVLTRGSSFSTLSTLYLLIGFVLILVGLGKLVVGWGVLEGHHWARQWGIIAIVVALVGYVFIMFPLFIAGLSELGRGAMLLFITVGGPALIDILVLAYLLGGEARSYFGEWERGGYGAARMEVNVIAQAPPPTSTPAQPLPTQKPVVPPSTSPSAVHPQPVQVERTRLVHPPKETVGWLVATRGPHRGERFALHRETLVGRDPNVCDVVLTDPTVSRQHAKIRLEGRHFYIYDMGSTAGTILNGYRIQRSQLMDNDRIRLGNTELVVKMLTT